MKKKTNKLITVLLIVGFFGGDATNIALATNLTNEADSTIESGSNQPENTEEKTTEPQEEEEKQANSEENAEKTNARSIYFPEKPSAEDIEGDKVLPGEIPLPEESGNRNARSARISAMNQEIIRNLKAGVFQIPTIKFQHNNTIKRFAYADGVGRPRGIVIHETANPNSIIQNEIKYMLNNWQNAFVHAYVDKGNIIEVHPTDYGAWGAGQIANQYFMHVELCEHVGDRNAFMRSVNNDAYYAAYKLKQYNLTPSRAKATGNGKFTGSVWSHHEVSSLLGGTNHTDPTGYFAQFGYTFDQFYELLVFHYNNDSKDTFDYDTKFDAAGILINNDNKGIYDAPFNSFNSQKIGNESQYLNKRVALTSKATSRTTGKVYYRFSIDNKEIGWLESTAFHLVDKIEYDVSTDFIGIVKSDNQNLKIYNEIYNTNLGVREIGQQSDYAGKETKVVREAKTPTGVWYKFEVGGKEIGWMNSKAFTAYNQIEYDKSVKFDMKFTNSLDGHTIYEEIGNTKPNIKELGKASQFKDKVVKITREAKTKQATWYQFQIDGKVFGWVNKSAFSNPDKVEFENDISKEDLEIIKPNVPIYDNIYGINSDVKIVGNLDEYKNNTVDVIREAKTNSGIWYKIKINGKVLGWVESNALKILNDLVYATHVSNKGWLAEVKDGHLSGTVGEARKLEAIKIKIKNADDIGVSYSTHVQNVGWTGYSADGEMGGTVGENKRLEGIRIKLTGKNKDDYSIYYRVHSQNFGWLDWAKDGEQAGTEGFSYRLEAIEIRLQKKDEEAPGKTTRPFVKVPPSVLYSSHVQNYGWQGYKKDGQLSGTTGQSKRIEALKVKLSKAPTNSGVTVQSHVENIGWQKAVGTDQLSGTAGQAKRVEGIRINLTGEITKTCDIYYRTHVQNFGWTGWAKNGESSGSSGLARRIEGIEIKVVYKDTTIGSNDTKPPFYGEVSNATAQGRFINKIASQVQRIAPRNDLFSSVMIAQACLESGYGTSKLSQAPNNNLFGIKWNSEKDGKYVEMKTMEDDGKGNLTQVTARFIKYPSVYESCLSNKDKLRNGVSWDPIRYRGTWKSVAKTYQNATKALTGTYATDIKYGSKLNDIIKKWHLNQFD